MNCLENENVCSVKKENNVDYYRLHTIWRKDGFFINITSKNGAWRGEMTPNDVMKMSVQLEMEPESYLNLCKEALTSHGGQPGLVYAVEDGYFAWKKVEDEDTGIKIKMGSVMLEPASFVDTIQNLVTAALNCNKNLQEKLVEVTEKKDKIFESKNDLLNKLNELIKVKEAMENDLYSRFVLLINTKKRKIQELEKLLDEEKKKNRGPENPYDIDTDNDSEEEIKKCSLKKVKGKANKKSPKEARKCNFLSIEVPKEKKMRNENETASESINFEPENYSCEPSTSYLDPENETRKKNAESRNLKNASTNDELYDYFYGEI